MTKPRTTRWKCDAHTLAKHRILREYLQAWLPIMGMTHPLVRVIDGFAGPGRYAGGEPGSPMIMLNAFLDHASRPRIGARIEYLFIEERLDRYEALRSEVEGLQLTSPLPANVSVDIRHGSFDHHMPMVAPYFEVDPPPTFAFVDPFGWSDAPMHLTSKILGVNRCEALIYVPLPFIARFVTQPDVEDSLLLLFGSDSWKAARDFDENGRLPVLQECFEREMLRHCTYVRAFEIRPDGNRGYTLFFGTRHQRGLEKMKEVMWKLDPAQGCAYSDSTDPRQTVLFQPTPDYAQLEAMLRREYGRKRFTIEQAEDFVVVNTPFAKSHLKRGTLKPAAAAGRLTVPDATVGRRSGTFPPGTNLRFVR